MTSRFSRRIPSFSAALLLAWGAAAILPGQGSLAPTTAPQPGLKTLRQIEPRTDLQASPAPAGVSTDSTNEFVITASGSYYLSANLVAQKTNAIRIAAADVTLDLNGFQILRGSRDPGPVPPSGIGVQLMASADRCKVVNGAITGFLIGAGLDVTFPNGPKNRSGIFRDLHVADCSHTGLSAGHSSQVTDCRTTGCATGILAGQGSSVARCQVVQGSSTGIVAFLGSVISDCSVLGFDLVDGQFGIAANANSIIRNCTVWNARVRVGIYAGQACLVEDCAVGDIASSTAGQLTGGIRAESFSTVSRCVVQSCNSTGGQGANDGAGISVAHAGKVLSCNSGANSGAGIVLEHSSSAEGNQAYFNGVNTGQAGIHVGGVANRIENNHCTSNGVGFRIDDIRNLVIRNSARSNGSNFVVVAGNRIARIIVPAVNAAAITGANSGSLDGFTDVDPWANFTF